MPLGSLTLFDPKAGAVAQSTAAALRMVCGPSVRRGVVSWNRWFQLLLPLVLFAGPVAQGAEPKYIPDPVRDSLTAPEDEPARLIKAYLDNLLEYPPADLPRLESYQWFETRALQRREIAFEFLAKFPQDPRRWLIVDRLYPGMPRFVKEWGPLEEDGTPTKMVVDEAAAATWKTLVGKLRAEMEAAPDIPDVLRRAWAARNAERQQARDAQAAVVNRARSGLPAPDFIMQDLAGKEVKPSDFRGKVLVLDFWATWCGPCKVSMPHTQEIAAKYRDQGVVILGSCTSDTRANFDQWVRENQGKYPDFAWAHDPLEKSDERASKKLYGVTGIPTQFIIDRDGRMVDAVIGYRKGDTLLEAALATAGIKVDAAILAQAEADRKNREHP